MTVLQVSLIVGSIVHIFAEYPYIRNTYLGRTKPNRVTFLLWSIIPMIAVVAGLSVGGTWALLPVFMSGFAPFIIFCTSFTNKNAYWKLGPFDYLCGMLSIIAILVWLYTENPFIAVVFSIIADGLAGLPTQIKAWMYPDTETGTGFLVAWITTIIGFLALNTYSFVESGFLIFLFIANGSLVLGVYHRNPLKKIYKEFAR